MPTKKRVALVVEDELPLLNAIRERLEKKGFQVVTARSAKQAENELDDLGSVDFIWLDHYLLGAETGLDFVAKIKGDDRWKKIPVFVVSVTAGPDSLQSYIALGISKYFTKHEYRMDQIIDDVEKFLAGAAAE